MIHLRMSFLATILSWSVDDMGDNLSGEKGRSGVYVIGGDSFVGGDETSLEVVCRVLKSCTCDTTIGGVFGAGWIDVRGWEDALLLPNGVFRLACVFLPW